MKKFTVTEFIEELRDKGRIKGRFKVDAPKKMKNHSQKNIHIVRKLPKGFISQTFEGEFDRVYDGYYAPKDPKWIASGNVESYIHYFPNDPNHGDVFSRSYVLDGGPSDFFPGSVAVLRSSFYYNWLFFPAGAAIIYLQYCFRQGSPNALSKSLARRYLGAREQLLDVFLEQVDRFGMKYLFRSPSFDKPENKACLDKLIASDKYETLFS